MKELGAREFRAQWTGLTGEVVKVTSRGRVLGHWVPGDNPLRWGPEEATVDEVKKAIEPDQVKVVERPGKAPEVSKGLGDIPGITRVSDPSFGQSRPAPKGGTKAK